MDTLGIERDAHLLKKIRKNKNTVKSTLIVANLNFDRYGI